MIEALLLNYEYKGIMQVNSGVLRYNKDQDIVLTFYKCIFIKKVLITGIYTKCRIVVIFHMIEGLLLNYEYQGIAQVNSGVLRYHKVQVIVTEFCKCIFIKKVLITKAFTPNVV